MVANAASDGVDLDELKEALPLAWSRETSADPSGWSPANSAWGQCAVTALVVQDYLGGMLRRGEVGPISHYWNVLPSGEELDLTRSQFAEDARITSIEPRTREHVLSYLETQRRYERLVRAVNGLVRARLLARV